MIVLLLRRLLLIIALVWALVVAKETFFLGTVVAVITLVLRWWTVWRLVRHILSYDELEDNRKRND